MNRYAELELIESKQLNIVYQAATFGQQNFLEQVSSTVEQNCSHEKVGTSI
jgi:hypothetical protein